MKTTRGNSRGSGQNGTRVGAGLPRAMQVGGWSPAAVRRAVRLAGVGAGSGSGSGSDAGSGSGSGSGKPRPKRQRVHADANALEVLAGRDIRRSAAVSAIRDAEWVAFLRGLLPTVDRADRAHAHLSYQREPGMGYLLMPAEAMPLRMSRPRRYPKACMVPILIRRRVRQADGSRAVAIFRAWIGQDSMFDQAASRAAWLRRETGVALGWGPGDTVGAQTQCAVGALAAAVGHDHAALRAKLHQKTQVFSRTPVEIALEAAGTALIAAAETPEAGR